MNELEMVEGWNNFHGDGLKLELSMLRGIENILEDSLTRDGRRFREVHHAPRS
jgi:hypothetical protein